MKAKTLEAVRECIHEIQKLEAHNRQVLKFPPETVNYIKQNQTQVVTNLLGQWYPDFDRDDFLALMGPTAAADYQNWFDAREGLAKTGGGRPVQTP